MSVDGERRWVLADDLDRLDAGPQTIRLLGPFDPYRKSGPAPTVFVELWERVSRRAREALGEPAERLAAFRRLLLAGVEIGGWLPRAGISPLR